MRAPQLMPADSATHMNILLITHHYEPELGAPQRRWSALIQRWMQDGHSVTVCCPPPHYPDKTSTQSLRKNSSKVFRRASGRHGETLIRMPYLLHGYHSIPRTLDQIITAAGTVGYCAVQRVQYVLRRWRNSENSIDQPFDVVISTVPGIPSLFAGVVVSKLWGVEHIAEMRDAWPDIITGDITSQTRKLPWYRHLIKRSIHATITYCQRQADAVVVTTEHFSDVLKERGIHPVFVVPNGAEPQEFEQAQPLQLTERHRHELRIQYLGTVGRSQGLSVVLDALKILEHKRPEQRFILRIIGEGAEIPALKQLATTENLKVQFIPPIPREELGEAYAWADVHLVSLRKTKPFAWTIPSKIFELLATRRRIIALVDGSAAKLLEQSGVATVIPPQNSSALADALADLNAHPEDLIVGESGVKLLKERYSYNTMAKLYQKALDFCQQHRTG